ncbi:MULTISPECIES: hypothetical protein [Weeksella]|uniref:Uncharacterized protein n=1 Tax=Weeksella virosa (strain ATCC 43766 / DSM 16922 / JCM 21250 / CCUG 30538 / CDC 9751 / IAM 14551 / NBRC 16016 / NCTC 11634 / CL345/78) TaxID=865938 RepID=F0P0K9_WEEVC|nr:MULTISPECIES: hypothetical protein [Weeksella]ADX68508.1 hypothetical protein Weevi_1818 [Weeksella virosa DSM 16922]MDK7375430.1 hypothetical protein [Weeksella virosa]MDK7675321.1 hypothetical protein [Weeksella virosa]OFM84487.1 hypothetical protein HMPREF2660_08230 [Weeksella sp. HMSC059D05]SUP54842.1 Uncharacterised protein [Weeksella virosa]
MDLPKFLIADNSDFPDKIFIIHTEFPRFVLDVETDDVEFLEDLDEEDDNEEFEQEVGELLEQALTFFDREMELYEESGDFE